MKFIIEVDDFWLEEDELTDALESHIKNAVVHQISASIKDKVELQIAKKVTEVIDQKVSLIIDDKLTDLIATETIKPRHGREISIRDHVKELFEGGTGWNSPEKQIAGLAKEFGVEMKAQYNAVFASNVVQGLKEQGLLKDDVVQMLLNEDKS